MQKVSNIAELIDVLGGPTKAAAALGASGPAVLNNWRTRDKIPSYWFLRHREKLKELGISAPESLWFA